MYKSSMDIIKNLPQSLDAEMVLLSNMINDVESIDLAIEIIKNKDEFYYPQHRYIFDSIVSLHLRGRQINRVSLIDDLEVNQTLEKCGGLQYVVDLSNSFITSARTKELALIIHEKFLYRQLIRISEEISDEAYEAKTELKELISKSEEKILNLGLGTYNNDLTQIGIVLKNAADEIAKRAQLKGQISGVTTGFIDLDNMLNGFQRSDLILLAARPSMGKTAIAINHAVSAANAGYKVCIFSLEMSKEQLALRIYSQLSGISLNNILKGSIRGADQWQKIGDVMNMFSTKSMYIDDSSGTDLTQMRSKLRRMKLEHGVDLVIIDYLQLMEVGGFSENRQQEISKISRGLKGIAKELDVPVIALSQLSRAPEIRSEHRPILSDLRESGAIEQDADVVMFLYRDEYYNKDSEEKGIGEVIIAKHRNGSTGTVKLAYFPENTMFKNLSRSNYN